MTSKQVAMYKHRHSISTTREAMKQMQERGLQSQKAIRQFFYVQETVYGFSKEQRRAFYKMLVANRVFSHRYQARDAILHGSIATQSYVQEYIIRRTQRIYNLLKEFLNDTQ